MKPSASAWAVNQLYWRERDVLTALIAAGDRYRDAQRNVLAGGDPDTLKQAEAARSEAIDTARRRAVTLLLEDGLSATAAVSKRVVTTLEALASYGSANPSPVDGRASVDVEPPGFSALAALAPLAPATGPEPEPEPAPAAVPAEQERWAVEAERSALDAEIDYVAVELEAERSRLDLVERELVDTRSRVVELTQRWEALKGRRRALD